MTRPDTSRWQGVRGALARARAAIGLDDLVLLLALLLLAVGFWQVWTPGAFIVPGLVLLWLVLPSRAPFVTRPPSSKKQPAPPATPSRRTV